MARMTSNNYTADELNNLYKPIKQGLLNGAGSGGASEGMLPKGDGKKKKKDDKGGSSMMGVDKITGGSASFMA